MIIEQETWPDIEALLRVQSCCHRHCRLAMTCQSSVMIKRCFSTKLVLVNRPKMRQRAVVSSFICTPSESPKGVTLAIFKRSQDVSTYRGRWAACSGSIEKTDKSPELAARREIQEETTLTDTDISLLRRGKPFSLIDDELQTEWTIHPFAFVFNKGAKDLRIDWEHTEYKFIRPDDLKNYETVPRLEYGLSRVLVGPETELALKELRDDHESGAGVLALKALDNLKRIVKGEDLKSATTVESFWAALRMVAWHLAKNGRPSMGAAIEAALFKVMDTVMTEMNSSPLSIRDMQLPPFKETVIRAIEARIANRSHNLDAIMDYFEHFINTGSGPSTAENGQTGESTTIVTLSSSSTLTHCFTHLIQTLAASENQIRLIVLESRPMFEGVAFVNKLLDSFRQGPDELKVLPDMSRRLEIEIFPDSSAALAVKDADYLVIGADRVSTNGDVSNKIGSSAAAVLAKTLRPSCKVLAVFETDKIAGDVDNDEDPRSVEYNNPAEITSAWPDDYVSAINEKQENGYKVQVKNPYFEWVPAGYVSRYITEEGVLNAQDIKMLSIKKDEQQERLFGDL